MRAAFLFYLFIGLHYLAYSVFVVWKESILTGGVSCAQEGSGGSEDTLASMLALGHKQAVKLLQAQQQLAQAHNPVKQEDVLCVQVRSWVMQSRLPILSNIFVAARASRFFIRCTACYPLS